MIKGTVWADDDIQFTVEYQERGPSLHVMVRIPPIESLFETRHFTQIVRFDCFENDPHYHVFGIASEENRKIRGPESVEWVLTKGLDQLGKIASMASHHHSVSEKLSKLSLKDENLEKLRQWMTETA